MNSQEITIKKNPENNFIKNILNSYQVTLGDFTEPKISNRLNTFLFGTRCKEASFFISLFSYLIGNEIDISPAVIIWTINNAKNAKNNKFLFSYFLKKPGLFLKRPEVEEKYRNRLNLINIYYAIKERPVENIDLKKINSFLGSVPLDKLFLLINEFPEDIQKKINPVITSCFVRNLLYGNEIEKLSNDIREKINTFIVREIEKLPKKTQDKVTKFLFLEFFQKYSLDRLPIQITSNFLI